MMCSFHTTCCTCCQPSDCTPVATTTTTTTTTTLCPDPLPCDTVYLTDCIVYSGCDDDCLQVYTGDTLTQVLANIFEAYEECYGPIETTTLGPLQEICLGYSATSNIANACAADCLSYYVSQSCYNNLFLDCVIYTDQLGTSTAPQGAYASNGGGLYFVNSNGVITGVTSCP